MEGQKKFQRPEPNAKSGRLPAYPEPGAPAAQRNEMDGDIMNTGKPLSHPASAQPVSERDKQKTSKTSKLDRNTRAKLGQQLRAVYDEVVSQGVPERFSELLNGLDSEGKHDAH